MGNSAVTEEKPEGMRRGEQLKPGELTGTLSFLTEMITTGGHQLREAGNRDATGATEVRLTHARRRG